MYVLAGGSLVWRILTQFMETDMRPNWMITVLIVILNIVTWSVLYFSYIKGPNADKKGMPLGAYIMGSVAAAVLIVARSFLT